MYNIIHKVTQDIAGNDYRQTTDMVRNGAWVGQWKKEMAKRCGLTTLLMFTARNYKVNGTKTCRMC